MLRKEKPQRLVMVERRCDNIAYNWETHTDLLSTWETERGKQRKCSKKRSLTQSGKQNQCYTTRFRLTRNNITRSHINQRNILLSTSIRTVPSSTGRSLWLCNDKCQRGLEMSKSIFHETKCTKLQGPHTPAGAVQAHCLVNCPTLPSRACHPHKRMSNRNTY
jgi:hypothetical protein